MENSTRIKRPRDRHGCLTAWLGFTIFCNSLLAIIAPLVADTLKQEGVEAAAFAMIVIIICGLANVAFAVALLRWRKWGFYGFLIINVVAFIANLALGMGFFRSISGLVGIAILIWLLHLGGRKKAWPHLR